MRLIKKLFEKKSAPAEVSEPAQEARPALTPQAWLLELFRRHGLAPTTQEDWVLPKSELPAIRGVWHPRERSGRLDVQVLVRDGVLIEECFAGIGVGDAGLADGLQNFTINSFHVLLSAFWHHHDSEQVEAEVWTVADRQFNAFIGNIGRRSSLEVTPPIPADMLSHLEAAIRSDPLEHELHWFRFYVANVNGKFTFESLKDNEDWPPGASALASCGWPTCDGFYSARLFMVLSETATA